MESKLQALIRRLTIISENTVFASRIFATRQVSFNSIWIKNLSIPAEIEKAVDLRHTPFTSDPSMPWKEATTQNPHSTLPTRPTILVNTIPTTLLLGKPADADDGPDENTAVSLSSKNN
jgi:hypothetical protein